MKKLLILLFVLTTLSCNAQEKEKKEQNKDQKLSSAQPEEKWDVKKEYDEEGNLIRYDSVYSWKYSTIEGDSISQNLDSIMDNFRRYFEVKAPYKWENYFSYFPKNDSLFMNDFFADDYFLRNWRRQNLELEEFIRQIDSSRNSFLRKNHPGLMKSKIDN
ncbi:hypothetical protein BC962_2751 [Gillisia mitskevichiae]|uniref:YARHG domain-containing protein n=1 Tax=Gillisia mitskevichiae TaxID=270921 RepID=A0A495P538_9FLAO|nr:hypothetical protein [Gillisia mitskevichiae]RKS45076.1 hypothetical protein BC962_2751 [Gillisia mitskevichiae]